MFIVKHFKDDSAHAGVDIVEATSVKSVEIEPICFSDAQSVKDGYVVQAFDGESVEAEFFIEDNSKTVVYVENAAGKTVHKYQAMYSLHKLD